MLVIQSSTIYSNNSTFKIEKGLMKYMCWYIEPNKKAVELHFLGTYTRIFNDNIIYNNVISFLPEDD